MEGEAVGAGSRGDGEARVGAVARLQGVRGGRSQGKFAVHPSIQSGGESDVFCLLSSVRSVCRRKSSFRARQEAADRILREKEELKRLERTIKVGGG